MKLKFIKKLFLLIALMLAMCEGAWAGSPESDTVWTWTLPHGQSLYNLNFVQNGQYILAGADSYIYKIDAQTGLISKTFGFDGTLYEIVNNQNYFLKSNDFNIYFVDLNAGIYADSVVLNKTNQYKYLNGDTTSPYSSSYIAKVFVSNSTNKWLGWWASKIDIPNPPSHHDYHNLLIINPQTQQIEKMIAIGEKLIYTIKFSPDGNYFAIGYYNGDVELWNGQTFDFIKKLGNYNTVVYSLDFSPDSKYLVSGGYGNKPLVLYDVEQQSMLKNWDFDSIYNNCNVIKFINQNFIIVCDGIDPLTKIFNIDNLNMTKFYPYGGTLNILNNKLTIEAIGESNRLNILLINLDTTLLGIELKQAVHNNQILKAKNKNNKLTVQLNKIIYENLKLDIYDYAGNNIKQLFDGFSVENNLTMEFDIKDLPVGIYFVIMTYGDKTENCKFIKE